MSWCAAGRATRAGTQSTAIGEAAAAVAEYDDDQFDAFDIVHGAAIGGIAAQDSAGQNGIVGVEQHDVGEAAGAHRMKALQPFRVGGFAVEGDENGQGRAGSTAFGGRVGIDHRQAVDGWQRRTLGFAQVEKQLTGRLRNFRHGYSQ